MADALSLLFQLDADGRPAVAEFQRVRKAFAGEIAALRKTVAQSFTLPPIKLPTVAPATTGTRRGKQADEHIKDFRRIEAEAAKSARAQEREQARLNRAVQSLQRQRSAAIIAALKAEERAAVASARAQERAARQASQAIASAFRGIGPGLQSIGRTLTVGITAPLLALGAGALKSAKDLDANVNTLKAFIGSAEEAEQRLAQLIKTARGTPGLTTNLALTLDAQLRVAQTTEETINRVLPAVGRLNAVSPLADPARFVNNLRQIVEQNFERPDLKELVGASPIAGQLITEIFNVDSPINSKAIRAAAAKMGITTVDAFFNAFADAAARNQGLANVTESIGTRFQKVVDRVVVALRPLGLAIINAIEPFVEPVAKLIERVGAAFASLSQPVQTAIIVIAGIAAAAGPVLFVLGSLATGITGVIMALGTIAAAVAAIGLPAIAAAVAGIVVLIAEWAVILAALGLAWKTNFLNIRELVTDAASVVLDAFNRIKAVLEDTYQRVLPTLQSITEKVLGAITAFWNKFGRDIVNVVSGAFEVAVRTLEAALRFLGNFIDLVTKLIDGDFRGAFRAFSRILVNAGDGLVEFFQAAGRAFVRGINRLIDLIVQAGSQIVEAAKSLADRFVKSLTAAFIGNAPSVRDALVAMLVLAVATIDVGSIATSLTKKLIAAIRRAAAEGVATAAVESAGPSVGGQAFIGAGILRKKRPGPPPEEAKGADAETRRRIRLLELEAQRAEAIAQQRISAENILFEQRKTSLKDFTDFQIAEEQIVFDKKKAVFAAERAEAEKLKKGRDLALGEIGLKELQAALEFADKRNQLLANQEREEREAAKSHRQAILDIQDEGDQQKLELIDSYVERYLISYEEAEKRRLKIEEDARDRRRAELESQLAEAGSNVQEQQRVNDAIAKLDAESTTAKEEAENRKRRAIRDTLEAELDYYDTLRDVTFRTTQLLRDAASIQLGSLISRFGDRRKFRLEALRLEREANEAEHHDRLHQIEQEKRDAEKRLEGVRDAEEKMLALRRYYANLERAENERRAAEREEEQQRESDTRDPFSGLRKRFEQFQFAIEHTNDSIAESLASLSEQVGASIDGMVDAFRQAVVANILYGESIGKALKAALAQQLAVISAEAAIQALKHAAYAVGSLAFGNFASAAKHAQAAALFGAVAVAAGLAGRALAKSSGAFNRGSSSTASAGVNGGNEPRNREFQNNGQVVESSSQAAREGSARTGIGGSILNLVDQMKQAIQQNAASNAKLEGTLSRINSLPAGQVVTMGAGDARQAIGVAVIDHSNADGDFNERLQRNLGFA